MHDLVFLIPVEEYVFRIGIFGYAVGNLLGISFDLIRIITGYTQHDGIIRRRTERHVLDIAADIGELVRHFLFDFLRQFFPRVRVFGDDDKLGVVISRQDRFNGQDKPRCPFADIVGIILQLGLLRVEIRGKTGCLILGSLHGRPFREGHFHNQFGTQGRREEFLGNEFHESQ